MKRNTGYSEKSLLWFSSCYFLNQFRKEINNFIIWWVFCYCSKHIVFHFKNFHDSICPCRRCWHFHCIGYITMILLVIFFTLFWFVMKRFNWLQKMQVDKEFASFDNKLCVFQLYIQFLLKIWSGFSYLVSLYMCLEHRYITSFNEIFTELKCAWPYIYISS